MLIKYTFVWQPETVASRCRRVCLRYKFPRSSRHHLCAYRRRFAYHHHHQHESTDEQFQSVSIAKYTFKVNYLVVRAVYLLSLAQRSCDQLKNYAVCRLDPPEPARIRIRFCYTNARCLPATSICPSSGAGARLPSVLPRFIYNKLTSEERFAPHALFLFLTDYTVECILSPNGIVARRFECQMSRAHGVRVCAQTVAKWAITCSHACSSSSSA